ncbi:hypothetical protein NLJ89_g580 [Agrocybe chaxingu]|uniref:Uncharacterized protein n=1 Tax=Agrocybe chaxingu TaxID=84603 RepID=A0A9W8N1N3_9AGAR|nr:hypothetical protein NLJ89_g580 [Agrocybe chaxingu]
MRSCVKRKNVMVSNDQAIIYDVEKNTEAILPDILNGVHITIPFDETVILLPLSPPSFTPELSLQDIALPQDSRITITSEGITRGWQVEQRTMPEMILMSNRQVLIMNDGDGATAYVPRLGIIRPLTTLATSAYLNVGLPKTDIARDYHSVASLTPLGNTLIASSNPVSEPINGTEFHTEDAAGPRRPTPIVSLSPRTAEIAMRYAKSNISNYLQVERPFEISMRANIGLAPGPSVRDDNFSAKARQFQKRRKRLGQDKHRSKDTAHERRPRVTEPPFYEMDLDIGQISPFPSSIPEEAIASTSDGRVRSLPATPTFRGLAQDSHYCPPEHSLDVVKGHETSDEPLTEREMKWNQLLTEAVRRARAFPRDI